MIRPAHVVFSLIALASTITSKAQSPCNLDSSFYGFQYINLPFAPYSVVADSNPGHSLGEFLAWGVDVSRLQSDDRIVCVVDYFGKHIRRMMPNGKMDFSYGYNGSITLDSLLGSNYSGSRVIDMELLGDTLYALGERLIAGTTASENFIFAVDPSGQIVSSFGQSGKVDITDINAGIGLFRTLSITPNGDLLVMGQQQSKVYLKSLNRFSGNLVAGFGNSGTSSHTIPGVSNLYMSSLALAGNGSIICAGKNGTSIFAMSMTFSGALNTAFNSSGYQSYTHPTNAYNFVSSSVNVNIYDNGDYAISTSGTNSASRDMFVIRIDDQGQISPNFGNNGWSTFPGGLVAGDPIIRSHITQDNRVLLLSNQREFTMTNADTSSIALTMVNGNGSLDQTFAPNGTYQDYVTMQTGMYWDEQDLRSAIFYGNGHVLLAGQVNDCSTGACIYRGFAARYKFGVETDTSSTLGIAAINNEISFKTYPNPFSDYIFIESHGLQKGSKLEIVDIRGKLVYQTWGKKNHQRHDVSSLKPGVYFVRLTGENGVIAVRRVIKSN